MDPQLVYFDDRVAELERLEDKGYLDEGGKNILRAARLLRPFLVTLGCIATSLENMENPVQVPYR